MIRASRHSASRIPRLLASTLALASLLPLAACDRIEARRSDAPPTRPPNLILIVLDTVRRDRVEPCGSSEPTTPNLKRLAAQATTFCRTVTPGSWTAPVHASMLTGLLPSEHGLDYYPMDITVVEPWQDVAKLSPEVPVLPEILAARGYQTALVSANPVLNEALGFTRGFRYVSINEAHWSEGNAAVAPSLAQMLPKLDPAKPLFLLANVWIAHNPYEEVPPGVGWVAPAPLIDIFAPVDVIERTPFAKFVRRQLSPSQEAELLGNVRRSYDWSVALADRDLGHVLDLLTAGGWLGQDTTIVVTSDHGELLGEHRMLEHGGVLYRENNDVFTVVRGPGFEPGRRVDSLVQSQDLFPTFLRSAGIPVPPLEHAVALQDPDPDRRAVTMTLRNTWLSAFSGELDVDDHRDRSQEKDRFLVSLQEGDDRVLWANGEPLRGEHVPGLAPVAEPTPPRADLVEGTTAVARTWQKATRVQAEIPDDVRSQLEALGYLH
ncbi:MAG: sulfatase [Myxococcota bacterium]